MFPSLGLLLFVAALSPASSVAVVAVDVDVQFVHALPDRLKCLRKVISSTHYGLGDQISNYTLSSIFNYSWREGGRAGNNLINQTVFSLITTLQIIKAGARGVRGVGNYFWTSAEIIIQSIQLKTFN